MSLTLSSKALAVKPSSTLAITAKAKAMKAEGIDVVGFGAGEPDFNTPQNICDAAVAAIRSGFTKYTPASGTAELKKAVSKKFREFNGLDYQPDQIVISNGGKHSLTNIFTAILNPGDEVIIPSPYWLSYPEIIKLAGGVPVYIRGEKANGYKVTAEQILGAVTEKTKAFVLNTPCNPTGMVYSREELLAIGNAAVEKDFYIVADEMYEQLVYGENRHISIASLSDDIYRHTITCSGLSKSYAMTGWRIGYTGSSKEIAKVMGSVQSHQTSNPNSIAQKAALEALNGPQDAVQDMVKHFAERRDYIYGRISAMPYISTLAPEGAFYVFVDVSSVFEKNYKGTPVGDSARLAAILLDDYQVAVVPCDDFGYADHIRLSYAISIDTIKKGMDRLEAFLSALS